MHMRFMGVVAAAALFAAGAAYAATEQFAAHLTGTGSGTGDVTGTLDTATKTFTYSATYSGLSGPATAAHFHVADTPGGNGPPVVPVASPASPISGTATLTDAQVADLEAGKWYFNVHTAANPGGEIRGMVMMKQP